MLSEIAVELPEDIELEGTLIEVESITWTENVIELEGELEAP